MDDDSADPGRPLRLTLVISSLTAGGAERVLTLLADGWRARGHAVTILVFSGPDVEPFFRLPEGVTERRLDLLGRSSGPVEAVTANVRRLRILRAAIRESEPDAVIAFLHRTSVLTVAASLGLRIPVIVAERTDPHAGDLSYAWALLRGIVYPFAVRIVVQTKAARAAFPRWLRGRIIAIPNPISPGAIGARPFEGRQTTVVALGRLGHEKGFDLLIEAFAKVAAAHPGWRLIILGEGSERRALEDLRDRCRVADRVDLPGTTTRPFDELGVAGIFVLPSRVEGFPNALIEAMAGGAPSISTDCRSGPAEIVHDGVDGLLVPTEDVAAMAAALDRLMGDPTLRRALGARATEVSSRLDPGIIGARWDDLIATAVRPRRRRPV